MRLNFEECVVGYLFAIPLVFVIGIWCAVVGVITAFLWALGGAGYLGTKAWRRLGVPAVISTVLALVYSSFMPYLAFIPAWGALSIGYGTPDINDPIGSKLGSFWISACAGSQLWATVCSRLTIFALFWSVFGVVVLIAR